LPFLLRAPKAKRALASSPIQARLVLYIDEPRSGFSPAVKGALRIAICTLRTTKPEHRRIAISPSIDGYAMRFDRGEARAWAVHSWSVPGGQHRRRGFKPYQQSGMPCAERTRTHSGSLRLKPRRSREQRGGSPGRTSPSALGSN
jgi:hypothetical protein